MTLLVERSTLWSGGTSSPGSYDFRPYFRIYYEQTEEDKLLLRTKITTKFYLQTYMSQSGQWVSGYDIGGYNNYINDIDTGWVSYSTVGFVAPLGYGLREVGTTETYISHAPTGEGSFNYRFKNRIDGEIYNTAVYGTLAVPTIQTAFNIAVSNFDIEQNASITIGITNSSYNYSLEYIIGGINGTIATGQTSAVYIWDLGTPLRNSIKELMNDTNSKQIVIKCKTYNGSNLIGERQATANVTISEKPIISIVTLEEKNETVENYTNSAYIVKHLSNLEINITATAPYGTSIKNYEVVVTEKTVTSTNNILNITDLTEFIIENDNKVKKINIYAIDNRNNRSEKLVVTKDFIDYEKCNYINTESSVKRAGDFDKARIVLKGTFYDNKIVDSDNVLTISYKYREKGTSTYTDGTTDLIIIKTDNTFTVEQDLDEFFDHLENYEFIFEISDILTNGETLYKSLPTSEYIMLKHKNGVDFKDITIKKQSLTDVVKEKVEGTVLYDNATGTTGNVTLSETSANFSYLEIFYKDENSNYSSTKVYSPNGKRVSLQTMRCSTGSIMFYVKLATISGTSISYVGADSYIQIFNAGASAGYNNSLNYILITRVLGYK